MRLYDDMTFYFMGPEQGVKMRVLIVDDHPLFRLAVKLIVHRSDMEVVGETGDGADAIAQTRSLRPDLVILDLGIPVMGGLQVLHHLTQMEIPPKVLVLTTHSSHRFAARCAQTGAQGFVSKNEDLFNLEQALKTLSAGRLYFPAEVLTATRRSGADSDPDVMSLLSNREMAVLERLLQGWDNKRIADDLLLSNKTVSTYKIRMLRKLNVDNIVDLVGIAKSHALL